MCLNWKDNKEWNFFFLELNKLQTQYREVLNYIFFLLCFFFIQPSSKSSKIISNYCIYVHVLLSQFYILKKEVCNGKKCLLLRVQKCRLNWTVFALQYPWKCKQHFLFRCNPIKKFSLKNVWFSLKFIDVVLPEFRVYIKNIILNVQSMK